MTHLPNYQLLFVTPVMSPSSASLRKHKRHSANLRMYARGRPHRRQRLRSRILYFGAFSSLAILAVVAIFALCPLPFALFLVLPERHADELKQLARFLIGLRRRHDGDVHAARLVDLHVVDLREEQ